MYLKIYRYKRAIFLERILSKRCVICENLRARASFPLVLKVPLLFPQRKISIPFTPSTVLWEKTITGEDFAVVLRREHKLSLDILSDNVFKEGLKIAVNQMLRGLREYSLSITTIPLAEIESTAGHPHLRVINLDLELSECIGCEESKFILEKTPNFTVIIPEIPSTENEVYIVYSKHGVTRQEIRKIFLSVIPNLIRKYVMILSRVANELSINLVIDRNLHPVVIIREEKNLEIWPATVFEILGFKILRQTPEELFTLIRETQQIESNVKPLQFFQFPSFYESQENP